MMRVLPVLAVLLLPCAAPASPIAEILCEETSVLTSRLGPRYGTEPHAVALRGPQEAMEVWRAESGDWALVARYATGTSCLLAMGESWEDRGTLGAEGSERG
ncbi:hypothetical protein [Histidinibacterium lentulum]|uniref:Uncharacterized protein n=1 Tax=Histidinibacterium lentulum TaxID=2480588 RepID=A0A3N2QTR4_9RHOB|nr:hypothetical protein [Histidinibacterium lentulum]ROT98560.1 hypothetical protein EAT49_16605 [Histidinibacterium lentulum]